MPQYLAPGVYVEEVGGAVKPITGVPTSTAGFVGYCRRGPTLGKARLVTSFAAFAQRFGGAEDLLLGGVAVTNHMAHAVRLFFENGGRRLYVARARQPAGTRRHAAATARGFIGGGSGRTASGLAALAEGEEVGVVAAPGAAALPSEQERQLVREALIADCEARRRFAILAGNADADLAAIRAVRAGHDSRNAALYYPWLTIAAGGGATSPEGAVAGVYARVDEQHGVHKAPGGEAIRGILGLRRNITAAEQDVLNPETINCLRALPGRGPVVWGARTMSADPDWRYVNVRRLVIFLERSIERGTQFAGFEPNAEPLWARVRAAVEAFLGQLWRGGALVGNKPEQAFFVRCDRTTMTQADIDAGRLVCLVGVAGLKPAEFVLFRIGQWTADAET